VKVLTILGTRPEIIKLSRTMSLLDQFVNHVVVHTGQNYDYELNQIFFEDLGIRKPDHFLDVAEEKLGDTIANIIKKSDEIFDIEKPDALLVLGDTNSCLSVISAKRRKIPVFHFEAGNRCFDQRVPEELNRKIVDHLSDINMPLTEHARRYLINEGIKPEMVIKTGSPMKEILNHYSSKIDNSEIMKSLNLDIDNYFLVSAHREENIDSDNNFNCLLESLLEIVEVFNKKVIVSTHPRMMKKLKGMKLINQSEHILFLKPMGFFDYVKLEKHAFCVLSDSGTITEESSILNFPAIMIREAHERPEGMDEGTLIMSGLYKDEVIDAIRVVKSFNYTSRKFNIVDDYDVDNFSKKILKIVLSYIKYINRIVWYKH